MMRMTWLGVMVLVGTLAVGCGGSDEPEGPTTGDVDAAISNVFGAAEEAVDDAAAEADEALETTEAAAEEAAEADE